MIKFCRGKQGSQMKTSVLAAVTVLIAGSSFGPVSAAQIDITSNVNANINTYFNGSVYPPNGGPITIGGIDFVLNAITGGGTGAIQTSSSSTVPFNIVVGEFGVTQVFTISNSAF